MDHEGPMNACIELHDSRMHGVVAPGGSVVVQFRPAYVHRSEGRPGIDPGTGWVQDFDLVVSEAVLVSTFTELPRDLWDGSLSVGDEVFENEIPLPLDLRGAVRFSAEGSNGERLAIQGARATAEPVGEARYVEEFPGTG